MVAGLTEYLLGVLCLRGGNPSAIHETRFPLAVHSPSSSFSFSGSPSSTLSLLLANFGGRPARPRQEGRAGRAMAGTLQYRVQSKSVITFYVTGALCPLDVGWFEDPVMRVFWSAAPIGASLQPPPPILYVKKPPLFSLPSGFCGPAFLLLFSVGGGRVPG